MATGLMARTGGADAAAGQGVAARGLVQRHGLTRVLDGLDLDVGTGVFGLLGPNGAGKTTLLRLLATVHRPAGAPCTSSVATRRRGPSGG